MKTNRAILPAFLLLTVSLLLASCSITPRTSALKAVHRMYDEDFVRFVLPAPGASPSVPTNQPPFASALAAIRKFRLQYGESSPEAAHLKVLEGMIYLQAGRPSMARLIASDVKDAAASLASGTGKAGRDKLFADNFADLVDGWQEIHENEDGIDATVAEWAKLARAAGNLVTNLNALSKKQLADPEADQGAIYLANTAAIFYVWAFELKAESDRTADDRKDTEAKRKEWYLKSRDVLKRFLSDTEIKAAEDATMTPTSTGRMRYLEWYSWLNRQLR